MVLSHIRALVIVIREKYTIQDIQNITKQLGKPYLGEAERFYGELRANPPEWRNGSRLPQFFLSGDLLSSDDLKAFFNALRGIWVSALSRYKLDSTNCIEYSELIAFDF